MDSSSALQWRILPVYDARQGVISLAAAPLYPLAMLEALAGRCYLAGACVEALRVGYLWHEFGDLHRILP